MIMRDTSLNLEIAKPIISIIVYYHNSNETILKAIDCIRQQTLKKIEIIVVDDNSFNLDRNFFNNLIANDSRIKYFRNKANIGLGASRNFGIKHAQGKFIGFVGSADRIHPEMFEQMHQQCIANDADLAICGTEINRKFFKKVHSSYDCDHILERPLESFLTKRPFISSCSCNKLYKKSLVEKYSIKFATTRYAEDMLFNLAYFAVAKKVVVLEGIYYWRQKQKHSHTEKLSYKYLEHIFFAFSQTRKFYKSLGMLEENEAFLEQHVTRYINSYIHDTYSRGYNPENVKLNSLCDYYSKLVLNEKSAIPESNLDKQIIVTLTSIPSRIEKVSITIESIIRQTLVPAKIVLYLDKDNFHQKKLPESLTNQVKRGLIIKYCDDIRSYKKIIYALEDYPDSILVIIDDDTIYPPVWLETLYDSYQRDPDAIHCTRAHWMTLNEKGKLISYLDWPCRVKYSHPSFNIFPTGCGGVLYPPGTLPSVTLRDDIFMTLAPYADDVWLKFMGLINGVKCCTIKRELTCSSCSSRNFLSGIWTIPNTQKYSLSALNVKKNKSKNDDQIKEIIQFFDLEEKLTNILSIDTYDSYHQSTTRTLNSRKTPIYYIMRTTYRICYKLYNYMSIISRIVKQF